MSDNNTNINVNIPKANPKQIRLIILMLLGVFLVSFAFYTVDANENAVVLRLGKYHTTSGPGLQFKIPLID